MTLTMEHLQHRRPTQRRGEVRVESICQAAKEMLAEDDWQGLRVSEVASRAGVSVGTFYHYFPSKEALVLHLRHQLFAKTAVDLGRAFGARFARIEDFLGALKELLNGWVDMCMENRGLERAVVSLAHANSDASALLVAQEERVRSIVIGLVKSQAKVLRPCDPEHAAQAVILVVDAAVVRLMRQPELCEEPRWLVDEVVRMVGHYLMSDTLMDRVKG
jgi:AcrR family transcriptional regulator